MINAMSRRSTIRPASRCRFPRWACCPAEQQQLGVGVLRRRGEQVALRQTDPTVSQVGALALPLDPLGDDLQDEGVPEVDQPTQDRRHRLGIVDGADERPGGS
ncbi:hypothetical protein [Geodermatophilus sp. DF01-2]|uniref:hypothetical protein n=1 Tax=Geodermatophilus sp. DF01-2 TaxID=2559610 RepID=UPI001FD761F6|nr:hypothetical protein [Geodermatophilus sp. DF01_2]